MFPGVNPRQMRKMMQRMGIKQQEIHAKQVIIKTREKEIIVSNPSIVKVNMMGQDTFQITGSVSERALEATISEQDIETVMEQAKVDKVKATKALKDSQGDLAKAIMDLNE